MKKFISLILMLLTLAIGQMWATDPSVSVTSGSFATSGTIGSIFPYTIVQNSGTNAPYTTSGNLRMYWQSSGSGQGNKFTITVPDGYTITGVTITASSGYTPTVKYNIDGGSDVTGTWSSTTMTISSISATSSFAFRNANTSSNTQLRPTNVTVYYTTATPAKAYKVSFSTGDGNSPVAARTESSAGAGITLPSTSDLTPACSGDGWVLYGWTTAAYGSASTTTAPTTTLAGLAGTTYYPTDDITLHAVYKRAEGLAGTTMWSENFTGLSADAQPTSPSANGSQVYNSASVTYTCQTSYTKIYTNANAGGTSPEILVPQSSRNGYFRATGIPTGGETSFTLTYKTNQSGLVVASSTTGVTIGNASGSNPYMRTITTNSSNISSFVLTFSMSTGSNARLDDISVVANGTCYYWSAPTCCTKLGSVSGSASRTSPTSATLTWSNVSGAEKYQVKVVGSSSHNDWTDATSGVSVTGLACGTAYTAYFRAVDTNGSHCSEGPESSTSIPASSWTVTSTGVTNATASPAIPDATCSGFSTTITAATGYALPENITVTNADKTWNNSTGALTISNVTGDVTITIAGTCAAPNITVHPASANYVADPNASATALSVTATAAGADLDYQWQSKVGEGAWTDIAAGDGGTAETYTPSRTSAGVTQYHVIVTNHVCSSSRTSDPATITVTAPSVCIAPTFTPAAGTYTGTQSVALSSETTDATVYYTITTDGIEPATPTSGSTAYSSAISVTQNTRIKAIAIKDGMQASDVVEAAYLIKCETPTFTPSASTPLTGTQSVTIACETGGATIYYTTDGTDPDNTKTAYSGAFNVASNQTVKAIAIKSGMENSAIATAAYQIKCETPTFSPAAGEYTGAQNVTITSATDGATIYYTTDGSDPDNTKTAYSGAFSVASNQTVKAIAIKSGMENSAIGSAAYTIKHTVTLNAGGGSVSADGWTASAGVWTKTQAGAFTLPSATPSAACGTDGWTFGGWVTEKVTSETTVAPSYVSTSYSPSADITLYAVYENTVADGPAEYTLVSSAANFTDGTYVVAALSSDRYYFMDGNSVAKGLGVETTGLASSSVVSNKFPASSLPTNAVEIDVEDDGEPSEDDHYYFMSYTSGNTTKYMDDNTNATTLTWTENTEVYTYHPDFDHNEGTNGCVLLSLSGAKISHNTGISNKESLIRNYASSGSFYNDIYFFKKGNSSSTHYTSNSSCVKYTLSSAVTPDKGTVTLGATQLAEDATTTAEANVTDDAYRFAYWTISGTGASLANADGEGKSTDNPVTVTMGSANATVTAHFEAIPPHTVTWSVNGVETTKDFLEGTTYATIMADAAKPAVADDAIKTNCGSDKFMGWATSAIADDETYGEVEWYNEATTLADDQTFYAVWATGNVSSTTFVKGTSADLTDGNTVLIVHNNSSKALENDGTWDGAAAGISEGKITNPAATIKWTVETVTGGFYLKNGSNQYLKGQNPSGGPYIALTNTANKWALTNDGTYVLKDENNRYLEYYSSAFTTYGSYSSNNANNYLMDFYVPEVTYSAYRTYCCNTPETALSITGANSVAVDNTLSPGTTGGNGGSVVWSIKAGGTGAATINPSTGVLTPSATGTVTIKAHQDEYNNKCAQDAEKLVEIVAATVNVTGVSLDHTTAALLPGETIQLTATVAPNDATDKTIGWESGTPAAATVSNAGLITAVAKGTSTVTVTTTDGYKTAECAVTVYGLTILKQDETGAAISAEGVTASATGKALTASATEASKYVFKGWKYDENGDGGLDAIANASNTSITLTGTPTGDVTIIAEFYKPVTITWLVDGEDAAAGSQTLSVARGTLWSALTPAAEPDGDDLGTCADAFVGWSNLNSELRGNGHSAPAVLFKNAQISSYSTPITEPITFRAVFATSAQGATFDGSAGDYKIYALVGETKYYAQGTGSKIESTTDASLATTYTFEAVDGGFAIKTGDYYITYSSSTNLGTSTNPYTWTVASGTKGTWRLNSGTSGRGWIYRAGTTNQFGGYATSNVTAAGTEYYDLEIGSDASYSNYVTVCCTPRSITVNGNDESESKTVSADATEICDGMTVNLSRNTSCTHYNFNKWVVKYTDGEEVEHTINVTEDANNSGSFTMPTYNVTVEGDWSPRNYTMTVNAPAAAKGSVSIVGGSVVSDYVRNVAYKSAVTLTVTENDPEHYYLRDWTIKNENTDETTTQTGNPLEIEMPGYPIAVTPNFADVAYAALTLGSAEGVYSLSATLANGDPIPDATQIKSGTALKVTYALSGQNEFVGWTFSVNSVEKSAEGTIVTFNMPEEDLNVSLNTRPYYKLNLSAEHGSITGVSIAGEAQTLAAQYIVHEGEVVALTAAPADDTYKFKEWTGATVSNGQFTVGTEDLDVVAVFELKTTYTLTLMALGSEQEKIEGILEGESIWEQIDDKEAPEITGQLFLGWSLMEDDKDMIISEGEDIEIGEGYTTLYAVYQAMTPCYVKVTSTSDIKNGKYLIVYETGGLAFDGGLETLDAARNTIGVEINTVGDYKTIEISNATTAAEFTIASLDGGGYSIKSASGMYIGRTGDSNGMNANANTQYTNTMSINNDGNFVCVGSGGAYMRYNSNSGQERFRYFKSDTYTSQKAIQLYKRAGIPNDAGETASIPTVTITTPVNADEIYPDGKAGNIVIEDGGSININTEVEMKDLTVEAGGEVIVNAPLQADGIHLGVENTMEVNSTVNVPSFSISVKLGSTGEATNVTVSGSGNIAAPEGYVDMELSNDANPDQWHAFTVPFEVDALNGIYDAETGAKLANEVNYAIMDYHGDIRAQGKYGWKKYRSILQPGVFYLITVDGASKVLRFMKKAGSSYVAPNSMAMKYYGDNDPENTNNGWCGVGNQNMFGGYVPYKAQILNSTGTGYVSYVANETKFSACIPFFIQIESDHNLAVSATLPSSVAARRVAAKGINDIKVTFGNENYSDKLYISANEDAKNAYEVGKDLVKMTMSNTPVIPQIFGKAYGNKLCMVYAPMSNDQAVYDLSLYAPANGEYVISCQPSAISDQYIIYLTKDGNIIWNLTMSAYPISLNKGTTEGYGLLLKTKAPQTPTGVEQSEVSRQPSDIQKIIIDDNVFILRGGKMYDVTGKAVK